MEMELSAAAKQRSRITSEHVTYEMSGDTLSPARSGRMDSVTEYTANSTGPVVGHAMVGRYSNHRRGSC